jgi:SpoVK/Ycf46/Vps4 family AAA+-type ATPase
MNPKDREIDVLIRARYPILYVVSYEETRVEDAIRRVVNGTKQVFVWSATEPFASNNGRSFDSYNRVPLDGLSQALDALNHVLKKVRDEGLRAVWILRDFDPYLDNPVIVRRLRDLAFALKRSYSTLVFLSPVLRVPEHLDKEVVVVDYDLPSADDLSIILNQIVWSVLSQNADQSTLSEVEQAGRVLEVLSPAKHTALVRAALGLTADEAANVFAKALVAAGVPQAMEVDVVLGEKKQIIRKTRTLEFYEAHESLASVGGLHHLKDWLDKRGGAFSEQAREYGLPAPRGVLLLGVPGCGKSMTAKAIGATWQLPLLRFDVGSVFGKYVGESEANLRRALQAAEAVAPCVLWVDEMEKAFSSSRGDDGGTTLRILGAFLSWLQDKRSSVFVVATANSVELLPPEMLRRGRLDEIFFVDLPQLEERAEIFRIHLQKRGRDASKFDLPELAQRSEGYSGAEIEQAVIAALYDAFDENRDINTTDVESTLQTMVPLSRTMEEEIHGLREWASTRARPASEPNQGTQP